MSETPRTAAAVVRNPDGAIWDIHGVGPIVPAHKYAELETELAAALAANQRLEKERDEAIQRAMRKDSAFYGIITERDEYASERDQLRAQVASLTADRIKSDTDCASAYIAMDKIVSERDRLMADAVQYRRALEDAREGCELIRKALVQDLQEPQRSAFWKAVELRDKIAALTTEHPGAPLVEAVGQAYEYLDRIHKGDPVPADMLANNAKACLKPFLPLDEPSKPS